MIIRIKTTSVNANIRPRQTRIVRVYDHRVPSGILESAFTQKGGLLVGTGDGTYSELAPGSAGQYPTYDESQTTGIKWETPSISISDPTNFLINGGFDFAQRQTAGTLTTISDGAYGADRWKMTRENADLQYQRNDATGETGLASMYYGLYKKITNSGKFMVYQPIEGANSIPLRGKTIIFQAKMKASSAKTIRMAILYLQSGGTLDTIPSAVTSWNVDSTDPTLGSNLAVITGAESKDVTTDWENFGVSVTVPSDSKNIICAIWSDSDFSANDTLSIAEAGLFMGSSLLAWTPRHAAQEMALCQRYYYLHARGALQFVTIGAIINASKAEGSVNFPVSMRTAPTLDATSGTDYYRIIRNGAYDYFNSVTLERTTENGTFIYNSSEISSTAGQAGAIETYDASAKIGFAAEL